MNTKSTLAATFLFVSTMAFSISRAEVPTGTPVFSNPLNITNRFFPFESGGMKVFEGQDGKDTATGLDLYLPTTRDFDWNGTTVTCHTLREINFIDGKLVEITDNFFAQADDGTVYYFGETVDNYEKGVIDNHEGSWLVGGPQPGDPPGVATAPNPAVFMPAHPELGDTFKPEDLFPIVDETARVIKVHEQIKLAIGKFKGCIVVRETTRLDNSKGYKTYAPGVGPILATSKGEILAMTAATLEQ